MRAPRWFREYAEWRWAPTLALTLAALTFIALALLLIPTQVVPAPNAATAGAEFQTRPAHPAQPAPLAASPVFEPRAFEEPRANAGALPAVQLAPPPATAENPPAAVSPPDFAANIADRADRPGVSAAPR